MKITARVQNQEGQHNVHLSTDSTEKTLTISPRSTGLGSSVNGGELLLLALATCFCNDLYREAAKRNIRVESVEVEVSGDFGADGEPGSNIRYNTRIKANVDEESIRALAATTDGLAEIQNTLRVANTITLGDIDAIRI